MNNPSNIVAQNSTKVNSNVQCSPMKCKDFENPQLVLGSAKPSRGNPLLILSTPFLYSQVWHKFCYHTLTIEIQGLAAYKEQRK